MTQAICIVPVSPLRDASNHRSEMVSQLLFGEAVSIIGEDREWLKVSCVHDRYEGWTLKSHVKQTGLDNNAKRIIASGWDNVIEFDGTVMHVPMGALLEHVISIADVKYASADVVSVNPINAKALIERANMFLNTPYLWGGRSVYGVDCSGFCQVLFRFFGYELPRDAYQQAATGEVVGFLQEARAGDLAFFDNDEGRIIHVGILIDESSIIHASGKVRIDRIDTAGIVNSDTGLRTHRLRVIKRYF